MIKSMDLQNYESITRREALLSIGTGGKVICRLTRDKKEETVDISNMKELQEVIQFEERKLYDNLVFYKTKN